MKKTTTTILLAGLLSAGCYHATIETGLQPNGQTITQKWAMSFVAGLVPPPTVETAAKCPNGVARVETQHSFLNSLVGAVTFGIVTPMQIDVACAGARSDAGGAMLKLGANETVEQAITRAAEAAQRTGGAVLVQL